MWQQARISRISFNRIAQEWVNNTEIVWTADLSEFAAVVNLQVMDVEPDKETVNPVFAASKCMQSYAFEKALAGRNNPKP